MRVPARATGVRGLGVVLIAAALTMLAGLGSGASGQEASQWAFGDLPTPAELTAVPRFAPSMSAAPDGETQVFYGGLDIANDPSGDALADTWTWSGGEWTARCGTSVPGATDPCGPGPRLAHATATGPDGLLLYGGSTQFPGIGPTPALFTDMWRWDDATSSWTQVCTDQGGVDPCGPGAEFLPAMAGNGELAVLFGGVDVDAGGPVDDTWVYDGSDFTQICGTAMGTPCGPIVRVQPALAWDGTQWVLFGGSNAEENPTVYGDAWVLPADPQPGDIWTQVCTDGECGPEARSAAGFTYLARPDNTALRGAVLYGGTLLSDTTTLWRDAWFWNGSTFSPLDVPWDDTPYTGEPTPGTPGVVFSVLGSRSSSCQVVLTGVTLDESTPTRLAGWDLDGDGIPGDCTEVVPTTTTTTAPTTTSPVAPSAQATTPPATLPATGSGGGAGPAVVAAVAIALAGGSMVLLTRRRRWLTHR